MSTNIVQATIKVRRDTAANFTSNNPTPNAGEWCKETDTDRIKIGDGSTAWTSLAYKDVREDTAANFTSNNPTLFSSEFAVESDTGKFKIGDGSTAWTSLGYAGETGIVATVAGKITGSTDQIAKAWVNFNGTGTVAINGSYNVTSITDHGPGDYTINFTNNFSNTDYAVIGMTEQGANITESGTGVRAVSSVRIKVVVTTTGAAFDPATANIVIFGT